MGYTKIVRSGDLVEVYRYGKNLPIHRGRRGTINRDKRNRLPKQRREDSFRRAKVSFRRIVRANLGGNERPTLLTLTMYQKLSYPASVRIFTDFVTRLRKREGAGFRYIAVPEFQKRGAVHWHVLIFGLDDDFAKAERESRYISRLWLHGFVDCVLTDGSPKLAGYLAKYMSKAMRDIRLGSKKAYYASRNIMRPMSVSGHTVSDYIEEIVGVDNYSLHQHEFDTQWLGRCVYQQYQVDNTHAINTNSNIGQGGE